MILLLAFWLQAAAPSPLEQGRALTTAFYQGNMDTVWARFSPRMRQAIGNVEALRGFLAQVQGQVGVEQEVLEEKVEAAEGLQAYRRMARFSKAPGRVMVQWALATDGTVEGFSIRPAPEPPSAAQLDYATRTELRLPF